MIKPITARLTLITCLGFIPPAAVLFVLALGDTIHQGNVLKQVAGNTAIVSVLVITIVQMLYRHAGARGRPPKPTKLFWWGMTLSITSSFFVLLLWLYTGRFIPPDPLNPRTLSPLANTIIWTGVAVMVLGVCMIMFDIVRLSVRRLEADVFGPLHADVESQRTRTFWPLNRFVTELDLFPTDEQAEKTLEEARAKGRTTRILRILTFALALGAFVVGIVCGWGIRFSKGVLVVMFPLGAITSLFDLEAIRRHLRMELRSVGLLLCIKCGYDLRGQVEPRCPECGTPFDKPSP